MAKETVVKYRKLEDDYSKYREKMEKKIDKLRAENQKLLSQGSDQHYNKQI